MTDKTKYKTETRRVDGCIITNINNIHDHEIFHIGSNNFSDSQNGFFINYQIMKRSKNITCDMIVQLINRHNTDDDIYRAFKIILDDITEFLDKKNNIFDIFLECIKIIKTEILKLYFVSELYNAIIKLNILNDNKNNTLTVSDNCLIDILNQYPKNDDKFNIIKMFINHMECKTGFIHYRVLSMFDDDIDNQYKDIDNQYKDIDNQYKYKFDTLQLINRNIKYTGSELYAILGLFSSDDSKLKAMKIIGNIFNTESNIHDLFLILQYFTSSKSRRDLVLDIGHKFKTSITNNDVITLDMIRKKLITLFDNIDHYREMCDFFQVNIDKHEYKKSYKVMNKNRLSSLIISDPCITHNTRHTQFFSIEFI